MQYKPLIGRSLCIVVTSFKSKVKINRIKVMNVPTLLLCICTSVCWLQPLLCPPPPPVLQIFLTLGFKVLAAFLLLRPGTSLLYIVYIITPFGPVFLPQILLMFFSSSSYSLFIPNWMHLQFQPGNKPVPGNVCAGSLQHGVYLPVSTLGATIKILHIHLFALGLWLTSHIRPYSRNAYRSN